MTELKPFEGKLLPCPFCGGEVKYLTDPSQVYCSSCVISIDGECKEEAIKRWNTRTDFKERNRPAQEKIDQAIAHDSEIYQKGFEHGKRWQKENQKPQDTRPERKLDANKIKEIIYAGLKSCACVYDISTTICEAHSKGEL